jgi:hypothetical protein
VGKCLVSYLESNGNGQLGPAPIRLDPLITLLRNLADALEACCPPDGGGAPAARRGGRSPVHEDEMVRTATRNAERAGVADQVRFQQGDSQRLPFGPGTFDAVVNECAVGIPDDSQAVLDTPPATFNV